MKQEKSCGALVYRVERGKIKLLMLRHRKGGHWSFPKGHVEEGETEEETALREVKEETGLDITLIPGFRQRVEFSVRPGVNKEVIYFLGHTSQRFFRRQVEEIREIRWMDVDMAYRSVTFQNDRRLIRLARERIITEYHAHLGRSRPRNPVTRRADTPKNLPE